MLFVGATIVADVIVFEMEYAVLGEQANFIWTSCIGKDGSSEHSFGIRLGSNIYLT